MLTKKLGQIFAAQAAISALSTLRKSPKTAFAVMKWIRDVYSPVYDTIAAYQRELLTEYGTPAPDGGIQISALDPSYPEFSSQWLQYINGEEQIKPLPLTMDALVASLEAFPGNAISEEVLFMLESFTEDYVEPKTKPASTEVEEPAAGETV